MLEILEGEEEHVDCLDHQFDLVKQIDIERYVMLNATVRPRGLAGVLSADMFTAEGARKKRKCRRSWSIAFARAKLAAASRVYWHAHETDSTACAPYNKVAALSGVIEYRKLL